MAFALFELTGTGSKVRASSAEFETVEAGLAHFGDKVAYHEISEDGEACDLFVTIGAMGSVYAIERIY